MEWEVEYTDEFEVWWNSHRGRPYRVLYAFDPRCHAILLLGGEKTGNDQWYERMIPIADRLLDEHLSALRGEEKTDG